MPAILAETLDLLERELRGPKFQGTDQARADAVAELRRGWPSLRDFFFDRDLTRIFNDSLANAIGRTPRDAVLETDPEVIRRVRYKPKGDVTQSDRHGATIKVGHKLGAKVVDDIVKNPYPGGEHQRHLATVPGELWFHLEDQPRWYYKTSTDPVQLQAFISSVAAQVSESTEPAALQPFPLMIKGMGRQAPGSWRASPRCCPRGSPPRSGRPRRITKLATEGQADAAGDKKRAPPRRSPSSTGRAGAHRASSSAGDPAAGEARRPPASWRGSRSRRRTTSDKAVAEIEGPAGGHRRARGPRAPGRGRRAGRKGLRPGGADPTGGEAHVYRQHAHGTGAASATSACARSSSRRTASRRRRRPRRRGRSRPASPSRRARARASGSARRAGRSRPRRPRRAARRPPRARRWRNAHATRRGRRPGAGGPSTDVSGQLQEDPRAPHHPHR